MLTGKAGRTAVRTNLNLQFGQGLYFSSVSGKANDYVILSEKVWRLRETQTDWSIGES